LTSLHIFTWVGVYGKINLFHCDMDGDMYSGGNAPLISKR